MRGADLGVPLRNEGNFWNKVPCCCSLEGSEWLLYALCT